MLVPDAVAPHLAIEDAGGEPQLMAVPASAKLHDRNVRVAGALMHVAADQSTRIACISRQKPGGWPRR
jgi:hypothetical protein